MVNVVASLLIEESITSSDTKGLGVHWCPHPSCLEIMEFLSTKSALREHELQHHPGENLWELKCSRNNCTEFFWNSESLDRHELACSGKVIPEGGGIQAGGIAPPPKRRIIRRTANDYNTTAKPNDNLSHQKVRRNKFRNAFRDIKILSSLYGQTLTTPPGVPKGEKARWTASIALLCKDSQGNISPTEYVTIANTLSKVSSTHGNTPERCIANAWVFSASNTDTIRTALHQLIIGVIRNEATPKLLRWYRSRIEELIRTHGTSAICALVEILKEMTKDSSTSQGVLLSILSEWECKARKAQSYLPLGVFSWSEVLHDIQPNERIRNQYTNDTGVIRWGPLHPETTKVSSAMTGKGLTWNANGLRGRLKDGEFNKLIQDEQPEYIHITELRSDVLSLGSPWEFRRAMAASGYDYCIFNWNIRKSDLGHSNIGNHGSAFFSRIRPLSMTCGLAEDDKDEEGRIITVRYSNCVKICTYTPCTTMNTPAVDPKRVLHETGIKNHFMKIRGEGKPVWLIGDINVAPASCDTTCNKESQKNMPGTKVIERLLHNEFKKATGSVDAQTFLNTTMRPLPKTWRGGVPGSWSARLDETRHCWDFIVRNFHWVTD